MPKRHYHYRSLPFGNSRFLSIIDGLESGLAIFVGLIVGLSFTEQGRDLLLLTAVIGIFVSALNAAAMRYNTEHFLDEIDGHEKRNALKAYFIPALIELMVSLIISSLVMIPLLIISPLSYALASVIGCSIGLLFVAGFVRGRLLGRHWLRDGCELALSGLLIISVGAFAGYIATTIVLL